MKITTSQVEKIHISGLKNQDPIDVIFEDFGNEQGEVFINSHGYCWSNYWGSMGSGGIKGFFLSCDRHYLTKKLMPYDKMSEEDFNGTVKEIKEHILDYRYDNSYTQEKARGLWEDLKMCEDLYQIRDSSIGMIDNWYEFICQKPTSECIRLRDHIIPTIKEALKEMKSK